MKAVDSASLRWGQTLVSPTRAVMRNDDGDECDFVPYSISHDWTMAQHTVDYPTFLDAWCFSVMFSDRRNRAMFDRRGLRRDKEKGTWERRSDTLKHRCVDYISLRVRWVCCLYEEITK